MVVPSIVFKLVLISLLELTPGILSCFSTSGYSSYFHLAHRDRRDPNTGLLFDANGIRKQKLKELRRNGGGTNGGGADVRREALSIYETALQCFTRHASDENKGRIMRIRESDQRKWGLICCSSDTRRIVFRDDETNKPNAVCVCKCKPSLPSLMTN